MASAAICDMQPLLSYVTRVLRRYADKVWNIRPCKLDSKETASA